MKAVSQSGVSSKRMQYITFISLIIDLLGFTVILPLFPALLEYYSKNDTSGLYAVFKDAVEQVQQVLGVPQSFNNVLFGGVLGSLFCFLQFLSSPITGALSDAYGRKPVLLMTLSGIALSYAVWAVSSNFALFVIARIIGGLSKGNVSLSYCIMTDVSDQATRSVGMALIGVAFSIGFIIGPMIGVLFSKWGSSGWFAATACYALLLAILNIIFILVVFKETLPKNKRSNSVLRSFKNAWKFISPVKLFTFDAVEGLEKTEKEKLQRLGQVYFLFMLIFSGLEFTITFVTHHIHGFTSASQAKMFTVLGLVMAVVQGGFVRRMKPGSEIRMTLMGLLMMIPSFVVIGLSTSIVSLYCGLVFYVIGSSLVTPCMSTVASKYGSASQKGTILGIWRSLAALGRSIGPIFASLGFWSYGAGWTYTVGGLLFLVPYKILKRF